MQKKHSKQLAKRIAKAKKQIHDVIGTKLCVCFLTSGNDDECSLMVSNVPRSYDEEEKVIKMIRDVCFPNLDFEITTKDLCGCSGLIFTPAMPWDARVSR